MAQYLWEEEINFYLSCPTRNVSQQRQEYLKILYHQLSKEILSIIDAGITFSTIGEVIKREEVLNLILLSFSVGEDILVYSPYSIFVELEDAYISGVIEPTFPFDFKTLISRI